ncbi:MAG: ribosomal protein S18-alanine N-acetyltransferase [Oscillospiraceae bacterium]|nr:ribosomal protein S18-alanine N-acetyltransferase [Oscillospiraceae bacterium]
MVKVGMMLNNISFEYFQEKYLDSVYNLEINIFELDAWSKSSFISELDNKFSLNLVLSKNSITIGYIFSSLIIDDCYISNFAISKPFQYNGFGKILFKYFIDILLYKKSKYISLDVRTSNINAIYFYEKFGFKKIYRRKNFYKNPLEDSFTMNKLLK